MKDHLYLCAPITLTYLDSCHFHSQASTHSEEISHLFLFALSHSAELWHLALPALPSRCPILELYCGHSLSNSTRTRRDPI